MRGIVTVARFSLAHLTVLGTTPLELVEIAAAAGYDYASIRTTAVAPGEHVTPLAGDPTMVRQVVHLVRISEFKRKQAAPVLKVTPRAFGTGWRMPIARG